MPVAKTSRTLTRREVRYRLYRIQSGKAVATNDGIKAHFQSQDEFDGWHNFGVTWDTGQEGKFPEGHYEAVPLKESLQEQWQRKLLNLAATFPTVEDVTDGTE